VFEKRKYTYIEMCHSKCIYILCCVYVLYMCLLMTYLIYVVAAAETIEDE